MTARAQPADQPVDLEALVRDVVAGVAVSAYARGIDLALHIDHRLPARAAGDAAALTAWLRGGLARTIEAGRTRKLALALWRGDGGAGAPVLLEACRAANEAGLPGARPGARLVELWARPPGADRAEPRPHRSDERAESVLVELPLLPEPSAPPLAEKWRERMRGRYMLQVRDPLVDAGRLAASLAALGVEAGITASPEAALTLARGRADAGLPVNLVLIDAHPPGARAAGLARALRADPRLAGALIVLAGSRRGETLPDEEARLFDTVLSAPTQWRLIEVFDRLLEARTGVAAAGITGGPRAVPDGAGIPDLAGRRILIAEDVAANEVLLRAILAPTGAAVDTVSRGDAALARHAAEPADLIVMDIEMPGMGGLAAARRIRALPGPPGTVPVVALTAYASGADRRRALDAGMDAYLSKPVVVAELYDLLRGFLADEAEPG